MHPFRGSMNPMAIINKYEQSSNEMMSGHPLNYSQYNQSQLQSMRGGEDKQPSSPGYFFESPSKYLSLKQYKQWNVCYSSSAMTLGQNSSGTPVFELSSTPARYVPVSKGVKDWFEKLCLQDKSIVLTIVDKQLVNLIYAMFKVYTTEGNVKFFNYPFPQSFAVQEANDYVRVKGFNLLYKRLPSQNSSQYTSYLKKIQEAENALITNIRLLNIASEQQNRQSEAVKKKSSKKTGGSVASVESKQQSFGGANYIGNFDALTLDLSFYKNTTYFFEIMRFANQHHFFLNKEMELNQDIKRLEQSVFYQDQACHSLQRKESDSTTMPLKFYTFIPQQAENIDVQGFTLGQCLLLIFEKAINVQYFDHMNKLDQKKCQMYFFFQEPSKLNNVLLNDQCLTVYWASQMTSDERENVFKHLDVIEKEMRAEEHTPVKIEMSTRIQETLVEEEEDDVVNQGSEASRIRLTKVFQEDEESQRDDDFDLGQENLEDDFIGVRNGSIYEIKLRERTTGISSSQATYSYPRGSDDEQEEESISYGYPLFTKPSQYESKPLDSDDDDCDIENQRRSQLSSGIGAVGKLKALKNIKDSQIFKSQQQKNTNIQYKYQDEDDEYEDDFEQHSDEDEGSSYFLNHESRYSKTQSYGRNSSQIQTIALNKKQEQVSIESDNPLVQSNKFYFVKQELKKYRHSNFNEHSSRDVVERTSFEFIKMLSTFISLQTVFDASSLASPNGGKIINFSSRDSTRLPNATENVFSIPIKQRLYTHLLKLDADHKWSALESVDSSHETTKLQNKVKDSPYLKQIEPQVPLPIDSKSENQQALNAAKNKKKREKRKAQNTAAAIAKQQQNQTPQKDIDKKSEEKSEWSSAKQEGGVCHIQKSAERQIQDEQFNLQSIKNALSIEALRHQIQARPEVELYNLGMKTQQSLYEEIRTENRHREERRSLLTGEILVDKYPEEQLNHILSGFSGHDHPDFGGDPTESRFYPTYQPNSCQMNEDIEMTDLSLSGPVYDHDKPQESNEEKKNDQKKKKRKKNKKKSKKSKQVVVEEEKIVEKDDIEIIELKDIEPEIIPQPSLKETGIVSIALKPEQLSLKDHSKSPSEDYNTFNNNQGDVQEFSPIIEQAIELPQDVKDDIASARRFDEALRAEIDPIYKEEHLRNEMATKLIQDTLDSIMADEESDEAIPIPTETPQIVEPIVIKKNKKNKKAQQQPKQPKLSKKQLKLAKKALLLEKKLQEEAKQRKNDNDGERPFELNNENLLILEKEQQETPDKSKKVVGFRMADTSPRHSILSKRNTGSSRGSSCREEEKIHQTTIHSLGELFPQEYKNPSHDTKLRISKITTSSSNSNKESPGSPSYLQRSQINLPGAVSKFNEDTLPNLNKKKAGRQPVTTLEAVVISIEVKQEAALKQSEEPQIQAAELVPAKKAEEKKIEFDNDYEAMFQVAYEKTSKDLKKQSKGKAKQPKPLEDKQKEPIQVEETKQEPLPKGKKKKVQQISANVKEIKERGAIARPSDIEGASQKKFLQTAVPIHRSQTPNVEAQSETLLPPGKHMKNNTGHQNHGQTQPTSKNSKQHNHHGQKQGAQKSNHQNKKKNAPQNQANQNKHPEQMQSIEQQQQLQWQNMLQQQQMAANFNQSALQQQMHNPNYFIPQHMPPYHMQPQFQMNQPFVPPSYFPPPDLSGYHTNSFQTPNPNPVTAQPQPDQQEKSSQQTQTDETRIKENLQQSQLQSQPFVMNQYQNINVQVHMPQQLQPQGFMPNLPVNPQFMPNYQYGQGPMFDAYQQMQQQFALQQAALQNQMFLPHGMPPHMNQPAMQGIFGGMNDMQGLQQLQHNMIFNSFQNQMVFNPQSFPANPMAPQIIQQPKPFNNQYHKSPVLNHHQLHNNSIQPMIIQNIINQLVSSNSSIPQSSGVSHMSQDQYEQQQQAGMKEEQFYFKMDQEIYKLQTKLKMKLLQIDPERQAALKKIEQQVRETYTEYPGAKVQMYGSMATGLAIDSSDMDLLVQGVFPSFDASRNRFNQFVLPDPFAIDRLFLIEQMKRLFRDLTGLSIAQNGLRECMEDVQFIESASVPVIKLVIDLQKIRDADGKSPTRSKVLIDDDMKLLKIDITFNDQQSENYSHLEDQGPFIHMGIKCCHFIKQKLQEYPNLESLTLVLKKFVALRNLNSPFMGGLNSYGLIILIVAFMNNDWLETYTKDGVISASRSLKGFLYYYGKLFDQSQQQISEQQLILPHTNYYSPILVIQDPLNPQNNIGKSTFNFDLLRQEFSKAHDMIAGLLSEFIDSEESEVHDDTSSASSTQSRVWKKKLDVLNKILAVAPPSQEESTEQQEPSDQQENQ